MNKFLKLFAGLAMLATLQAFAASSTFNVSITNNALNEALVTVSAESSQAIGWANEPWVGTYIGLNQNLSQSFTYSPQDPNATGPFYIYVFNPSNPDDRYCMFSGIVSTKRIVNHLAAPGSHAPDISCLASVHGDNFNFVIDKIPTR